MSDTEYTTIRVWKRTQRKLRLLAALENESMISVVDDVISQRLREKQEINPDQIKDLQPE